MNDTIGVHSCETIKSKILEETNKFRFFSGSEHVRSGTTNHFQRFVNYISVPNIDVETTINALCRAREGKSSAIYSPFYESHYMPYPLILSARPLLFGQGSYSYLVIGGRREWPPILERVYCHGNTDNHPLFEDYGFRDILNTRPAEGQTGKRKARKYIRWVFSGFHNDKLWYGLKDIALVIVDLTSDDTRDLERIDIEAILAYSSKESIPVIFCLKNPLDKIGGMLYELGVEIIPPTIVLEENQQLISQIPIQTHDEELKDFLTQYNLRSFKFSQNKFNKIVEIKQIDQNGYFQDFYRQYLELKANLKTFDSNSNGRYAISLARKLYDSVMEFPGAVNTNGGQGFDWRDHTIGQSRENFSDKFFKLSLTNDSVESGDLFLERADAILREFEFKPTPKGHVLIDELKMNQQKNLSSIIMGEKNTLSDFIGNIVSEEDSLGEITIVSPEDLENAKNSDSLIMLTPVYNKERAKLLTSCTERILMLNYPWEVPIDKKAVEEVKTLTKSWENKNHGTLLKTRGTSQASDETIKLIVTQVYRPYPENRVNDPVEINEFLEYNDDLFQDSEGSADDKEEEWDEDEDYSYLDSFLPEDDSISFSKWKVPIENMEIIIPENRKIVVIRDNNKPDTTTPSHLKPGDLILISKDFGLKTISDFVWDIMEKRLRINRRNHPSNEWREKLREYMRKTPGISYSQVYEKLSSHGAIGIKTPSAIYLWLESEDIIGPKDLETLQTIANFLGLESRLKDWQKGIKTVRSIHNRMMRYIWRVAKYSASKLNGESYEDYDIIDPRLGISIPELAKLVRFVTVTGPPKKIE